LHNQSHLTLSGSPLAGWTGSTGESVNVNATNRLIATTKHRQSSRALIIASNSKTQKPITVACCLLTLFNCGGGGKQLHLLVNSNVYENDYANCFLILFICNYMPHHEISFDFFLLLLIRRLPWFRRSVYEHFHLRTVI